MEPGSTTIGAVLIKIIGPTAGTFLALVVIPPRTIREALSRSSASLICGIIFAPIVNEYLHWSAESILASGTIAAFLSWWLLGGAVRVVRAKINARIVDERRD